MIQLILRILIFVLAVYCIAFFMKLQKERLNKRKQEQPLTREKAKYDKAEWQKIKDSLKDEFPNEK